MTVAVCLMSPSRLFGALVLSATLFFFAACAGAVHATGGEGGRVFGGAQQGFSVALSADGNTAIVGGPADYSGTGAARAYTRSNGVWTQQGGKLVGADGSA